MGREFYTEIRGKRNIVERGDGGIMGGKSDFRFRILDFILGGGCVLGVGGPRVEPGAKRGGGPGGARAVFLWF